MEPYTYENQIYRLINLEQKAIANKRLCFWRELLSHTVEGRRVEIITMTSSIGIDPHNTKRMAQIYQAPFSYNRPY